MNRIKFLKDIHAAAKKQFSFYLGKRSYKSLLSSLMKSAYASLRFAKEATLEIVSKFNNALTYNP